MINTSKLIFENKEDELSAMFHNIALVQSSGIAFCESCGAVYTFGELTYTPIMKEECPNCGKKLILQEN